MLPRRLAGIAAVGATVLVLVSLLGAEARPFATQPFPDSQEYADSARHLIRGEGFVTTVHGPKPQPPRYPPGYPLALAPFAAAGTYPYNVERGAKAYAAFYVVAAVFAAWALGGPLAALLAAVFVGTSPFAHESAELILSDALGAALTVLLLPLLRPATRAGARLGGAVAGITAAIRLISLTAIAAHLIAAPRRLRPHAAVFAAVPMLGVAALQWVIFGSPLETGYSYWRADHDIFMVSHLWEARPPGDGPFVIQERLEGDLFEWTCPCGDTGPQGELPNAAFYPALLAGLFWVFAPPLATLPALVALWRWRREPAGRFAIAFVVLSVGAFGVYEFQAARFMASTATVLLVLSSVVLAGWLEAGAVRALGAVSGRARPG
ncbi:MAG TPA: hypothetical protein VF712_07890 [Thermoleophilaceae bacterium]